MVVNCWEPAAGSSMRWVAGRKRTSVDHGEAFLAPSLCSKSAAAPWVAEDAPALGGNSPSFRSCGTTRSQAEAADPGLIPAQVVGQLVAHGALDLRPEQLGIATEVALQGVLEDDDAVRIDVAGDGAADVLAIGVVLTTAARDDHRSALEQLAELIRQVIERLHHQLVELARRPVRGRQQGESLAAVDQPPELWLRHLLADQRHGHPGGDEHDRNG